ncbi:MAG: hypothetical protein ACYDDI_08675 [Candidatus Acidiferrales bacterium]
MSEAPHPIQAALGENQVNGGTFALREAICEEVNAVCVEIFGKRIRAIVLTGSLARDEGTFLLRGDTWVSSGDAEFIIVASWKTSLPSVEEIDEVGRQIESRLLQRKIDCQIDLGRAYAYYLRNLPPHIFSYELRECGKVIWGDASVLNLIPQFSAEELDLEDAWCLLCNRLIELLGFPAELISNGGTWSAKFRYQIQKLYLDMATSYLVFVRAYAPGYQKRQEILSRLARETPRGGEYPFDLQEFARRVAACTDSKVSMGNSDGDAVALDPGDAIHAAHCLWRWELARLAGSTRPLGDCELIKEWMRSVPLHQRVRGWLVVLSASGWHKNFSAWPRWFNLCRKASPRGCVYFVGSGILFKLIEENKHLRETDWRNNAMALTEFLPVRKLDPNADAEVRWEDLASDVTWNYQRFLVGTRA